MAVTADLTRKDSCIYCGGVEAVLPVGRLALDGKRRYAHPSCVVRALEENPADSSAALSAPPRRWCGFGPLG